MHESFNSLRFWTPFDLRLRAITVVRIYAVIFLATMVALSIVIGVTGNYHLNAYTFWSFTILGVFSLCFLVASFLQGVWITLVIVFFFPVVAGNVVIVCIMIIIILQTNIDLFLDGTTCDPDGTLHPGSVAFKHTGDWIIHGGPVALVLLLLIVAVDFVAYIIVGAVTRMSSLQRWFYFGYWLFACAPFVLIYDAVFDIGRTYPSSFSWVERFFLGTAVLVVWMGGLWFVIISRRSYGQLRPRFVTLPGQLPSQPVKPGLADFYDTAYYTPGALGLAAPIGAAAAADDAAAAAATAVASLSVAALLDHYDATTGY